MAIARGNAIFVSVLRVPARRATIDDEARIGGDEPRPACAVRVAAVIAGDVSSSAFGRRPRSVGWIRLNVVAARGRFILAAAEETLRPH